METTPFGVNSQTCHKALITTIKIDPPGSVPVSATRRISFGRLSVKKQSLIVSEVSSNVASLKSIGTSPDYFLLVDMFLTAKQKFLGIRATKRAASPLSPALWDLQRRFSESIEIFKNEGSRYSFFVADNLEKLLYSQYKIEKKKRTSQWIRKMNDLDFRGRTRAFFSEIRKTHITREESGPICNRYGIISDNLDDTLRNWSEYYQDLYSINCKTHRLYNLPTPEQDSSLDKELTLEEFVTVIYSLKGHKSHGFD